MKSRSTGRKGHVVRIVMRKKMHKLLCLGNPKNRDYIENLVISRQTRILQWILWT